MLSIGRVMLWGVLAVSIAFFVTVSSVVWTRDVVHSQEELAHVSFGFPIPFVSQSFDSHSPPVTFFPHAYGLGAPQEYPLSFFPRAFLGAWLLTSCAVWVGIVAVYVGIPATRSWLERFLMWGVVGVIVLIVAAIALFLGAIIVSTASMKGRVVSDPACPEEHCVLHRDSMPIPPPVPTAGVPYSAD